MNEDISRILSWKFTSPEKSGMHTVVEPGNSSCALLRIYRLNLKAGESHKVESGELELNGGIIEGSASFSCEGEEGTLKRFSSFYMPGGTTMEIAAEQDLFVYIAGAPCEGAGSFFTRNFDPDLKDDAIHQTHGQPPYEREVYMTINQEVPGSRLICGFTWGDDGKWTSWPPHQHTKDLEEVYCYFDIPAPRFALHLGYTEPGTPLAAIPVSTGDCVEIPEGYHPTVATPGVRSAYFWAMAAHSRESRRYDLAVNDPSYG